MSLFHRAAAAMLQIKNMASNANVLLAIFVCALMADPMEQNVS